MSLIFGNNSIRKSIGRTLLHLALILFSDFKIFACDCLPPSFLEQLKNMDVIAVGRLIRNSDKSVQDPSTDIPYGYNNFEVIRFYKGLSQDIRIVSVVENGTNCDFRFNRYTTDTFLIYAYYINKEKSKSLIGTNICTKTKSVNDIVDKDELEFYRNAGYLNDVWQVPKNIEDNSNRSSASISLLVFIACALAVLIAYLIYTRSKKKR